MLAMDKIIAPVDFSERSIGAARYLEALAEHFGSTAILLHVLPPPHYEFSSMEVGGAVINELFETRAAQVEEELKQFAVKELPGLRAERVLLEGDPARQIVDYAHRERAGLIIVPTHGYGPFRRFILGSVTAKILHDADCPVWTGVHLEEAPDAGRIGFRTIVAAVDLGEQSVKVLRWAHAMAESFGARLILFHAAPPIENWEGEYPADKWQGKLAEEAMARLQRLQGEAGLSAEVMVEAGDAPEAVCSVAKQAEADLLVIGRGSAAGVFGRLRANAYSIIRQSPCPVVSV